jgi:DMSO/TMAO reductase YedYZ molybdopterin-dependent catalytic subunit
MSGGPRPLTVDRAALLAMPQHTAVLPIACVEGWSTIQTWSGVRLADLARLAGVPAPESARVSSLERSGAFARATLQGSQVLHPDALLALRVNGTDLSPDHGFPARIIVPALPGVHNTKWVAAIAFVGSAHA